MIPRFLSERFQPKGELVVLAPSSGRTGDSLPIEMSLRSQEDLRPRQVRIELVGRETYFERQRDTDSRRRSQTRIVKREAEFSREFHVLERDFLLASGMEQDWSTSISVPVDAPSTCRGELVDIRWVLRGVVDVLRRPDLVGEVPLQVYRQDRVYTMENVSGDTTSMTTMGFEECNLILTLGKLSLTAGEALQGNFQLEMVKELSVRGIKVQLVQMEDAGARDSREVVFSELISGPVSFNPYETHSFDFVLVLPPEAPPTAYSPHSSLRWRAEVVLDRPMRTDYSASKEVIVLWVPDG
jgi:hypothetical protein